jgi:GH35 family endo-1,4-beta-xylanase
VAALGWHGPVLRAQPVGPAEGHFTYAGREEGAAWRREALARIETIRKGDFIVRVADAAGAPQPGATVRIEEKSSSFQWGSALQFVRLVRDTPDNLRYRQVVLDLFNAASPENDLKWPVWDGDWGPEYGREQSLAALRWLRAHHFYVRGHNLVWPGWKDLPASIVRLRGTLRHDEIPGLVLAHIREITAATRGLIDEWDVLNEPFDHHDLMTLFGDGIMTDWFQAARQGAPGLPLFVNDWGNQDILAGPDHCRNTYRTVALLQRAGAPLGGIGLQCHIVAQPSPPENILATLDLYAGFHLPIRITEFDFNTTDERLQADYTRDFLILAFSHPLVVGVQLWGFWEKAHWRPHGAMFRSDWSEKPNAQAYCSLVLDQWRTRLNGQVGPTGIYAARGFYGDYVVTVEANGRRAERAFRLLPGDAPPVVDVTLP